MKPSQTEVNPGESLQKKQMKIPLSNVIVKKWDLVLAVSVPLLKVSKIPEPCEALTSKYWTNNHPTLK